MDLTLVVLIGTLSQFFDELSPELAKLSEHTGEDFYGFVLVHFLMENAEVLVVFGGLPALIMLTTVNLTLLWLILSEIEALRWEHF